MAFLYARCAFSVLIVLTSLVAEMQLAARGGRFSEFYA
jgi:hypothetical protein